MWETATRLQRAPHSRFDAADWPIPRINGTNRPFHPERRRRSTHPDRRVTELKPWARAAVTIWVLTTLAALASIAVAIVINAPSYLYLRRAWQSLILQLDGVGHGARIGSVVDVLNGAIGAVMLLLPVAGITLTYVLLCRGTGTSLALRQDRANRQPRPMPGTPGN